jgi:trehalose-phosphatase
MLNDFWSNLTSSIHPVLLLDYDGTLAPFRIERDKAIPYPGIRDLLKAIQNRTLTRLVVISGRAIDDLLPLLDLDPPPEIWGCHGWERLLADGRRPEVTLPDMAREGLSAARDWVHGRGLDGHCEEKPASLAVHWRGLSSPEQDTLRSEIEEGWQPIADCHGLVVHSFDGGLEMRCPGRDKGTAVQSVLKDVVNGEAIAFLGDDLTDEDGFKILGGQGLSVLVRKEPRSTLADIQITPPDELLDFLTSWLEMAPPSPHGSKE